MPASRSARAITFAPRSCPSSPGFATSTRIFELINLRIGELSALKPVLSFGYAPLALLGTGGAPTSIIDTFSLRAIFRSTDQLSRKLITQINALLVRKQLANRIGELPR